MTPLVSIIIPCYNQARYLPFALQSVQAQTFSDWEVILVNDGSTDDTAVVAAQFASSRLHYVFQGNQGLSAARNTGIRAAQGEYLAFLDSDDEWEPQFLEECVKAIKRNSSLAGIYTRNVFIDPIGQTLPSLGGKVVALAAFRKRQLEGGYFPINAVLVRAAIVRQVGLFDTQLTSEEDWDLWLRISEHYVMQAISKPLARYRIYTGSMSNNAACMHSNRISVLTKYFGPPVGEPCTWPTDKRRAYAFAFRSTCIGYLQQAQVDEAWQYLEQGTVFWPHLLGRLDTMYELACGDKPWGTRGQVELQQLRDSGWDMVHRLEHLLNKTDPQLRRLRRVACGNCFWALGMLADQSGQWQIAKEYLTQALSVNPRLGLHYPFVRRLLKVSAGPRLVATLRKTHQT